MHDTFTSHGHPRKGPWGPRAVRWTGRGPWAEAEDPQRAPLRRSAMGLIGAIRQLRALSPEKRTEAQAILDDARRKLYLLLASDTEPSGPAEGPDTVV
jgi:hypothetical protein